MNKIFLFLLLIAPSISLAAPPEYYQKYYHSGRSYHDYFGNTGNYFPNHHARGYKPFTDVNPNNHKWYYKAFLLPNGRMVYGLTFDHRIMGR